MDVLIVLVFVSLLLVFAGLILLFRTLGAGDSDHAERLSLLPLADDEASRAELNDTRDKENP